MSTLDNLINQEQEKSLTQPLPQLYCSRRFCLDCPNPSSPKGIAKPYVHIWGAQLVTLQSLVQTRALLVLHTHTPCLHTKGPVGYSFQ